MLLLQETNAAGGHCHLIDRVFVDRAIAPNGIAGVSVAFPFMLIMLAFGMLGGFGGAALISMQLGQQRKSDAERSRGPRTKGCL
jgi:Na+-driven multidrug efflux pump